MSALRVGLSEEDGYRDVVHVTDEDTTEPRTPSPAQVFAIGLLELNPRGLPRPRLSLASWRHVDRVVAALAEKNRPEGAQSA